MQALRSVHEWVGEWERQQRETRVGESLSVPVAAAVRPMAEAGVPPREVFPVGRLETGVGVPRAVLTPAQQAQLDEALARAFSIELPEPPRSVVAAARPRMALTPEVVMSEMGPAARQEAPPTAMAELPPAGPLKLMPAPAALMAAAPPLPAHLPLFAAPSPESLPVQGAGASVPDAVAVAAPAPAAGSSQPFSPFQWVGPAPAPRAPVEACDAPVPGKAAEDEASWPSSPFFGAVQAATAPFRMVEPPPVIASTPSEAPSVAPVPPPVVAPDASSAPWAVAPSSASAAPASFPPLPDRGQVFNFAELLRANGQR